MEEIGKLRERIRKLDERIAILNSLMRPPPNGCGVTEALCKESKQIIEEIKLLEDEIKRLQALSSLR